MTTTIMSDTTIDIDAIEAPLATPILATLMLNATSTGPATSVLGGVVQAYSGTFSITGGGNNYLSGTFTDAVFGAGSSLTLAVSGKAPGESVSFTSSVIAARFVEGLNRSIAFRLTDVAPSAAITSGTLRGFSSDVSGDFNSSAVPEASTWAMMGLGFLGLGFVGLTRRRKGLRHAF